MLNPYLAQIPSGAVKTVLCGDVMEAIAQLEQYEDDSAVEGKVVAQTWENLPDHEALLEELLHLLAKAALALWPLWYGQETGIEALSPEALLLNLGELRATGQEILSPWLKAARVVCRGGKLPVFKHFSRTLQVSQLAAAISPEDLAIVLGVSERRPSDSKLLSLAGAAMALSSISVVLNMLRLRHFWPRLP